MRQTQTYIDGVESTVTSEIDELIDGAPEVLDTLNELAAAMDDDGNFATTITNYVDTQVSGVTDTAMKCGIETISNTVTSTAVVFDTAYSSINYAINVDMSNIVDSPASIYDWIITAIATTGFTVTYNGAIDSANFKLHWLTREV